MLDRKLWTSFEKELTPPDIERIEARLEFLRDILEDAIRQFDVEDVRSELDLNLHIYLKYFELAGGTDLTAWLIHDSWFGYYLGSSNLHPELSEILRSVFFVSELDLRSEVFGFLSILDSGHLVSSEMDAVVWLSFLDYMASKLIYHIGHDRFRALLQIKE